MARVSDRVSRRRFLGAAAGGAVGLTGILASGRAPAVAQTRELTFLTIASFVPETDKELKRQFEEWGARNKVKVRLDSIAHLQLVTKKASEVQSRSGHDITALGPQERVRRGLACTFQINTLFAGLNALEAVTLAVAERRGLSREFWSGLGSHGEAIDEAYEILRKLRLGDSCYQVTRELPYGRQRLLEIALALATRPKVLLLDEPAAGVPPEESGDIFEAVASLSDDLTLLFIEHDMHVVFRFASHIIVLVGGAIFTEGSPAEIAADPGVREVYLGKRKHG